MTVYFARALGRDRVKIGYVQDVDPERIADGVARRLRQVGYVFGVRLELMATTPGSRRLERWFHQRHVAGAVGREWFRLSPKLQRDIDALCRGEKIEGSPAPAEYNHVQNYRWWQEYERGDGSTYWAQRRTTIGKLAKVVRSIEARA